MITKVNIKIEKVFGISDEVWYELTRELIREKIENAMIGEIKEVSIQVKKHIINLVESSETYMFKHIFFALGRALTLTDKHMRTNYFNRYIKDKGGLFDMYLRKREGNIEMVWEWW